MSIVRLFLICLPPLALAACDFFYGVSRFSPISLLPESSCVETAMRTVPGVTSVTHTSEQGGRPLSGLSIESPDQIERFRYKVSELQVDLYFSRRYDGTVTYSHSYIYINRKPPQSEIDTVLPVMKAVEDAVHSKCAATDSMMKVQESCLGVQCTK